MHVYEDSSVRRAMNFTRRQLLGYLALSSAHASAVPVEFMDYAPDFHVDVQASGPRVKAYDLRRLTTWEETPAADFFTFHQTKEPPVADLADWRLKISGALARPRVFTYAELSGFPAETLAAVIECSGNTGHSRIMNGLVSNGVWRGPKLAPLLRECGVLPEAREVVLFGADVEAERKWPAGDKLMRAQHGRSIFIQDAMEGGAMLALEMNGKPLPPEHGFPLRLILPGWYGMTQVKWLNRIVVLDGRYEGRHMARNYHSIREDVRGLAMETSIRRNRLKSVVARVEGTEGICRVSGAAWGGQNSIERVEVRVDDGPWLRAELSPGRGEHSWRLWSFDWRQPAAGEHRVVSRAIDSSGAAQPERPLFLSAREENAQWVRRVAVHGFKK